jgi:hypothetical protein
VHQTVAVAVDAGLEGREHGLRLAANVHTQGGVDMIADARPRLRFSHEEEEADHSEGDDNYDADHRRPRRQSKAKPGPSAMLAAKSPPGH